MSSVFYAYVGYLPCTYGLLFKLLTELIKVLIE